MNEMNLPDTPQGVTDLMNALTFLPDESVGEVPPPLESDEDVLVPRSVRLPMRLDDALGVIATRRGIAKSDLIRGYLQAAVAAEAADQGSEVLIPLSAALRALAGLPHQPRGVIAGDA